MTGNGPANKKVFSFLVSRNKENSIDCLTQATLGTMKNEDVRMILIHILYILILNILQLESAF